MVQVRVAGFGPASLRVSHALSHGHHLCEPQSNHEKTAPEPRWRDILPNAPLVLFKGIMVIKNKKKH